MSHRHDLVEAALGGNRDAFAELLEEEVGIAYRVARVIVGSDASAQDAVQEACIRAWHDLGSLRDAGRWSAWFRRVAVRAAIDQARRDGRGRRALAIDQRTHVPDASEHLATADELARALARLSSEQRAIIGLRFVADMAMPDLARALGIREGTAKSRLHRALHQLRSHLEADDR